MGVSAFLVCHVAVDVFLGVFVLVVKTEKPVPLVKRYIDCDLRDDALVPNV